MHQIFSTLSRSFTKLMFVVLDIFMSVPNMLSLVFIRLNNIATLGVYQRDTVKKEEIKLHIKDNGN